MVSDFYLNFGPVTIDLIISFNLINFSDNLEKRLKFLAMGVKLIVRFIG